MMSPYPKSEIRGEFMACKFCPLGCDIIDDDKCCFECKEWLDCSQRCEGMPKQYKECDYYKLNS
jgi:hypothetical protein